MDGEGLRALLSQNLKKYRALRGFSQMELAERAEISVTYLGAIERRERWPHPDILSRLANALAVEVRDIFTPENAVTQDMNVIVERLKQDMAGLLESASLEMLGKAAGGATKPKK